jgi:hypothetical protein
MFKVYKSEISQLKPSEQTMFYNFESWKKWLPDFEIDLIHESFKGEISRQTLFDYAKLSSENSSSEQSLRLFIACMMWGYGSDLDKKGDGRGPFRVLKILSQSNAVSKIHDAFLLQNELEKSYKLLISIKGLGVSFLSKFLYFSSKGCGIEKYALIFDARVANSLVHLNSNYSLIADLVNVMPSDIFEHYNYYVDMLHKEADKLDCKGRADNIELFLFERKW